MLKFKANFSTTGDPSAKTARLSVQQSPVSWFIYYCCLFLNVYTRLFVLVVSCPKKKTYDVLLTEFFANSTLSEIKDGVNENGDQVIRRITETDTTVVKVKRSNEALFPGALIVMSKETSENGYEEYRVTRYWQEIYQTSSNWI